MIKYSLCAVLAVGALGLGGSKPEVPAQKVAVEKAKPAPELIRIRDPFRKHGQTSIGALGAAPAGSPEESARGWLAGNVLAEKLDIKSGLTTERAEAGAVTFRTAHQERVTVVFGEGRQVVGVAVWPVENEKPMFEELAVRHGAAVAADVLSTGKIPDTNPKEHHGSLKGAGVEGLGRVYSGLAFDLARGRDPKEIGALVARSQTLVPGPMTPAAYVGALMLADAAAGSRHGNAVLKIAVALGVPVIIDDQP